MSRRSLLYALGLALALIAFPTVVPTRACTAAYAPTLEQIAQGSRLIFLGRMVTVSKVFGGRDKYEMQVERRLRGDVGGRVSLTDMTIGLCHDGLRVVEPRVGQRFLIARGFRFRGEVLDAFWRIRGDDSVGNGIPDTDFVSLEDLQRALVGEMPDTASIASRAAPDRSPPSVPLLLAAALSGLYVARRYIRAE